MARLEMNFGLKASRNLSKTPGRLALLGSRDAGVRLTVTLDPSADLVLVDKNQVQRVLTNLSHDSMEAMQVSD